MEAALRICSVSSSNSRTALAPSKCFASDCVGKSGGDRMPRSCRLGAKVRVTYDGGRLRYKAKTLGVRMSMEEASRDENGNGGLATGGIGGLGNGTGSDFAVPEMLNILQRKLEEAKATENYDEAAKLRDIIRTIEDTDPVIQTRRMLSEAIAEERYSDAAKYRDELKKLEALLEKGKKKLKCYSDTITQGVRVRVRSIFVKDRSLPAQQQYFFAYRLRISNESDRTVQLLNRHWIIKDANGHVEEVRGPGVIGEQPVLRPGTSFEYTSACPLRTESGTMEGEYEMIYVDESIPTSFQVKIGTFALSTSSDEEEAE